MKKKIVLIGVCALISTGTLLNGQFVDPVTSVWAALTSASNNLIAGSTASSATSNATTAGAISTWTATNSNLSMEMAQMNRKLAEANAYQQKRDIALQKAEIAKEQSRTAEWIKSNAAFLKKAPQIKKLVQSMTELYCMANEIIQLREQTGTVGFSTCAFTLRQEINYYRINSKIDQMMSLMLEIKSSGAFNKTSGLEKETAFDKVVEDIDDLAKDLSKERNALINEIEGDQEAQQEFMSDYRNTISTASMF